MHKYHSSRLFQGFAIVVLSSLCLLLNSLTRINFNKMQLPSNHPQYNAAGIDGTVYSKDGKVLYTLLSDEAWEYPNSDRIYLKQFVVDVYNESSTAVSYHITSDDGWVNHVTKRGLLGNNTVITIPNPNPEKIIRFYGKNINLDLVTNIFSSNEYAHAIEGSDSVYSHGFIYDKNKQFLTLESQVKVTYLQTESGDKF